MGDYAIEVDNLGKRYMIGPPRTVGMKVHAALKRLPLRRSDVRRVLSKLMPQRFPPRPAVPPPPVVMRSEFWALRDVSFKVKRGEVLGIIGRNGAGKSTLLKILSRITAPTEGRAIIRGQVGSLLEVGTGFHPDLSGRENIYLNGVTLGMTHREVEGRFEEIVDFAEIEQFIDTPVKHYSSGMYMRLAFAVAAHLVADVMMIDEVLAVGDAAFQRKCLGRMDEIVSRGQTILIVSHSTALIRHMSTRAILLRSGRLEQDGDVNDVIETYAGEVHRSPPRMACTYEPRPELAMTVEAVRIVAPTCHPVPISAALRIEIDLHTRRAVPGAYVGIGIRNVADERVYWTADTATERYRNPQTGRLTLTCQMPAWLLTPGKYKLFPHVVAPGRSPIFDGSPKPLIIDVEDHESTLARFGVPYPGYTAVPSQWNVESSRPADGDATPDPLGTLPPEQRASHPVK